MRRLMLMIAAVGLLVSLVPSASNAGNCWPIPENSPACHPIPWPQNMPLPMPGGYEANIVIANGTYLPSSNQAGDQKIDARWGGSLYVQNLDGEGHTVTIVGPGCQAPFTSCAIIKEVGVPAASAGPVAGRIALDTRVFQAKTIYPFYCRVPQHFDGQGNPLHWGYLNLHW